MVQADICKYIILSDTDRKKGDLQYPHPNVVHRIFTRISTTKRASANIRPLGPWEVTGARNCISLEET